ncbi:MAG: hypothetical protein LBI79_05730 [Nitrososphaerota archaeon]|nr:hypothetical protein [Nitrososphaerota archaeon]
MGSEQKRTLLTLGFFFLAITVAILFHAVGFINWTLIVPVVFVFCGLWLLALGAIRMGKTERYERSGFSTIMFGLITLAVGGAWFVFTINWLYSVVVILLVVAALAIVAALQHK